MKETDVELDNTEVVTQAKIELMTVAMILLSALCWLVVTVAIIQYSNMKLLHINRLKGLLKWKV